MQCTDSTSKPWKGSVRNRNHNGLGISLSHYLFIYCLNILIHVFMKCIYIDICAVSLCYGSQSHFTVEYETNCKIPFKIYITLDTNL